MFIIWYRLTSVKFAALFILCFFFRAESLFAQGTSNEGSDFWVAYAGHVDGTDSRLTLFITSKVNASVNIDVGGTPYSINGQSTVSLNANELRAIVIDANIYNNVYVDTRDNLELHPKKGIHITSDEPIVVYSHISRSARSAACLVYPTKALGSEYYAIAYDQLADAVGEVRSSQFTVVGVENNTEVEITPTQASRWFPARPAGVPFIITLNKGDIYQFQSKTDITGSRIRTLGGCKPVAVFSGSSKTGFCEAGNTVTPEFPSGQDNLYQQLLPVSTWGRNFVTAPFYNSQRGNIDIYRIQISQDNTIVTINGSTTQANSTPLSNPYSKGAVITFSSSSSKVISANEPINLVQYQTSQSCNSLNPSTPFGTPVVPGDPEMTILNPIEQTLKDITVYSAISRSDAPTNITSHYINIIIKTADAPSLTVDGIQFQNNASGAFVTDKFIKINDLYSYIIVDVTASSQSGTPTHRIKADGGFVAIAYGYGPFESYGYLAGSDLKNLNQYLQPEDPVTGSLLQTACSAVPFGLYLLLSYKTASLKWDIGKGIETDPNPDQNYTTQTINGQLFYKYRYFKDLPVFAQPGIYNIKAIVVNPRPLRCDANETVELNFTVSKPPTANFNISNVLCAGSPITFNDNSTGGGLEMKKWIWDFGDGTTPRTLASGKPFTYTYAAPGDYVVNLTVEGESGCRSSSFSKALHISEPPKAKFSFSGCKEIQFKDESTSEEGTITKWSWKFNDPAAEDDSSEEQNPVYTFSHSGKFNVMLTVTTDKGCSNTYSLEAIGSPKVDAGPDITILKGGEKELTPKITGENLRYKWTPSTGLNNDTIPNPIASPENDIRYTLIVTADGRCTVTDEIFVTVVEPNISNAFSPNNDGINDRWVIRHLDTYVRASVQVFNRYGQKVFVAEPYVEPWDGTYNGKQVPVGVYYYIIEPNNGGKRMVGSITLVR
jgi:gliding motility-associated-like protein